MKALEAFVKQRNAFNKLFALWNARYVVGRRDACTQATEQRLECLIERGTLADLRLYNRPAVLTLTAPDGRIHQVVLAALDDERAIVSLGGAPREVRVGELARLWFGEFVLLWRPDVPQARPLSIGMRGKDVQQLRSDLARLREVDPTSTAVLETHARALFDSRRYQEAADAFTELVERSPAEDYAHYGLGMALWRLQRFPLARDHLAMAAVMRPQRAEYARALAQVRATLKARAEAGLPLEGPVTP